MSRIFSGRFSVRVRLADLSPSYRQRRYHSSSRDRSSSSQQVQTSSQQVQTSSQQVQTSYNLSTLRQLVKLKTYRLENAYWMDMSQLERMLLLPDVFSGLASPILKPPPIEMMTRIVERMIPNLVVGQSYSAFSSKTNGLKSAHLYIHSACIGTTGNIAVQVGLQEDIVREVLSHAVTFPILWTGCMPYGGVTVDICPNPDIASEVIQNSRLILTKGRDPILFSNHTSIPRSLDSGITSSATYFLAQTLYGHALTGSVLHYLLVMPNGQVMVIWIGAGVGPVIVGGHLNNIVALHDQHGIWPAMVRNLRELVQDPELFGRIVKAVQGSHETKVTLPSIVSLLNAALEARHQHRSGQYALGAFLNEWGGAPIRTASRMWGGTGTKVKGTSTDVIPHKE